MGIKRIVDVQFWNDDKVLEYFSPEDKLFMLYLMTNPHTTQLGIYAINKKHISFELGYTVDVINVLIDRFENKYGIIKYSNETRELAIKNYLKYSIIKGGAPVRDLLVKELKKVKNKDLITFVFGHLKGSELLNETVKNLIKEYEEVNGEILYSNEKQKQNEKQNDNDNEKSYPNSSNESVNDTSNDTSQNKKTINYQVYVDEYHQRCTNLPKVRLLTDDRKKAIKDFEKTLNLEQFKEVCDLANKNSFLTGTNDRGWKATFDFLLIVKKAVAILEGGKYANKNTNNNGIVLDSQGRKFCMTEQEDDLPF